MRTPPDFTPRAFRPDQRPALDRLVSHLAALQDHLREIGHPGEAAALLTALDLTAELRREQRRVAA
jgi:hypothetical protein